MVICCPRACGRLAAAAAFLGIGIVQVIAGMVLLRSKYVYLLSGPNFWTAAGNIAVGSLLGVSATVWKNINRKTKHAAKRNLLAALASTAILLNGTTAIILILGESNSLLSIHLENGKVYSSTTMASEILAYAYATSVCSPVVCVVVSIAFLTGICFRTKNTKEKSLDIKSILHEDSAQIFNWVYTPKLPKPNPEVLRTALSSESELSSSDSDSSCSSSVTPVYLQSHTSLNETRNNHQEVENTHQSLVRQKAISVHSTRSKNRIFFADESIKRTSVHGAEIFENPHASVISERPISTLNCTKAKNSVSRRQSKPRGTPKILFTEYPSGDTIRGSVDLPYDNDDTSSNRDDFLSPKPLKIINYANADSPSSIEGMCELNTLQTYPNDSVPRFSDTTVEFIEEFQPRHHGKVRRTSTADQTKDQDEIQILNNSEIPLAPQFISREVYSDEIPPLIGQSINSPAVSKSTTPNTDVEVSTSATDKENGSSFLKNSSFRSKLASRLVPVSTPVVSDLSTAASQKTSTIERVKTHSKSKKIYHNYVDCHRSGLSSFKCKKQVEEQQVNKKHNSVANKSSMKSISELSVDEANDTFLPCTSAHTSGYLSALEDESGNESDSEATSSKNRKSLPSVTQESVGEETTLGSQKKISCNSMNKRYVHPDHSQSLRESLQNVLEQFMKENPRMKSDDISQMLQASVV